MSTIVSPSAQGFVASFFSDTAFDLACATVNRLLRLEPSLQARLAKHAGRSIQLVWPARAATVSGFAPGLPFNLPFKLPLPPIPAGQLRLCVNAQLQFERDTSYTSNNSDNNDNSDKAADVSITVLAGLLEAAESERLRFVRIEGDALLAQDLSYLAQHLRWDAEQDLAGLIGGSAAFHVLSTLKKLAITTQEAAARAQTQSAQWLLQDSGWLASAESFAAQSAELTQLNARIDQLERALDSKLQSKLQSKP